MDNMNLNNKLSHLKALLEHMGDALVAFSGGVDSTLLLKVAHDVLGEKAAAITAVSPLSSHTDWEDAVAMAELIGAVHYQINSDDLKYPEFTANTPDKCYHCKKRRLNLLRQIAGEKGFHDVLDGTNRDDFNDYRPGLKAVQELGIRSPLSESGLNKEEIRWLSRQFGLPTWDKPSFACLASRVPYGDAITSEKLGQIDRGETFLRGLGVCRQLRVRHHGAVARIEVEPHAIHQFMDADIRGRIADFFRKIGFQFVTLDIEGYSMGSLNRGILSKEKHQNG